LRQVFRIRAVTGKPVTNVEDPARVAAHKLLPGRTVALEALLDQLSILLQRIISLESCPDAVNVRKLSTSACQLWNEKCSPNVPSAALALVPTVVGASYASLEIETRPDEPKLWPSA
jgi:hypothetical protein